MSFLTIHGFDAMLKAETDFDGGSTITGDSIDVDMVQYIARKIGITVDSRTDDRSGGSQSGFMDRAYTIPLPTGFTYREILGYIAGMYGGNFLITDQNKLRLVTIYDIPRETNLLIDTLGLRLVFGNNTRILV